MGFVGYLNPSLNICIFTIKLLAENITFSAHRHCQKFLSFDNWILLSYLFCVYFFIRRISICNSSSSRTSSCSLPDGHNGQLASCTLYYTFIAVKQCFPFIIHLLQLSNVFTGKYVNFLKTFTPHENYVKKILKTFIIWWLMPHAYPAIFSIYDAFVNT